jgi:hypothetical protein
LFYNFFDSFLPESSLENLFPGNSGFFIHNQAVFERFCFKCVVWEDKQKLKPPAMIESKFIIAIVLFWAGFIASISFMDTWLKVRSKGAVTPIALNISKTAFSTLNFLEWLTFIVYLIFWILRFRLWFEIANLLSLLLLLILIFQTVYLLPNLKKRVDALMESNSQESSVFTFYITMEYTKVVLLLALGYIYANQFIGNI